MCGPNRFPTVLAIDHHIPIILYNEKGAGMTARSGGPARMTVQIQDKVSIMLHDELGNVIFRRSRRPQDDFLAVLFNLAKDNIPVRL